MFAKKSDTTIPRYTEQYSPQMQALCEIAISIMHDVVKDGNGSQPDERRPTEDVIMGGVMGTRRHLSADQWEDLGRLFADLGKHSVWTSGFETAVENMIDDRGMGMGSGSIFQNGRR